MRIEHVALWTRDLPAMVAFWQTHFGADASCEYASRNRPGFRSVFLTLPEGARIELMTGPWVAPVPAPVPAPETEGWAHIAVTLGSPAAVDDKARTFQALGLLQSGPRQTGDGYYEAVVTAPGGLLVEITA